MFDFAVAAQNGGECFFYVRIPGNIGPGERGDRFEEPLEAVLAGSGVGRVTGGGSQLGEGKGIEFCGIDVVVTDNDAGLHVLKEELRRLQVPAGTIIEEYLPSRIDHPVFE